MSDEVTTPSPGLRSAAVPAGTPQRLPEPGAVFGRRLNGTIVCVVDDRAGAEATIEVGRRLAAQFDARMLLVSIRPDGGIDGADEEQRIADGDPAEAVARIAADEAANVIVVGARAGLRTRTLRRGLAADLAATAPCPVVVALPRIHVTRGIA